MICKLFAILINFTAKFRNDIKSISSHMEKEVYHIPAMLSECIEGLNINGSGIYVDVTFGGGGHSRAIMSHLSERGRLLSFDQDIDAYANRIDDPRFTFVHSNFRYLNNFLRYYDIDKVDGILADLGVSFHHFDEAKRGFSFRADAPLDMRMNQSAKRCAADIINLYDDRQLTEIFSLYGEMKRPAQLTKAIIKSRETEPILTTGRLLEIVRPLINPKQEKKELAQIFQALRIEVNGEMEALKRFLESTLTALRPGGRLVILTYHSLEDRMVKNFIKSGNTAGLIEKDFFGRVSTPWQQITKGAIPPTEEEIAANPRSRSAKLRVAQLIDNNH